MNRKILVPLATALAAGAVAVGSGATFSSETGNTISAVTAGTLKHTNSKADAAIFSLTNIKPGDTVNGTVTLTNTGSLPANFTLTESSSANGFANKVAPNAAVNNLQLAITDTGSGATVYNGNFGDLVDGTPVALGIVGLGEGRGPHLQVQRHPGLLAPRTPTRARPPAPSTRGTPSRSPLPRSPTSDPGLGRRGGRLSCNRVSPRFLRPRGRPPGRRTTAPAPPTQEHHPLEPQRSSRTARPPYPPPNPRSSDGPDRAVHRDPSHRALPRQRRRRRQHPRVRRLAGAERRSATSAT